ncbi:conserved unknown protein [Ectocarpus siliculosus]|uniref:WSC domain-containing protein n=1 Tax=Ectocarpus siliculosus TaxID=2880 RepID=D7FK18_ECTSI|nr:conserved unknown protein [Ectocarpus siliculosus]|eukprot:CBJ49107.1 conserved unknown protein [Ectocarpus siliculosus]
MITLACSLAGTRTLVHGAIDITCDAEKGNHIDWDGVFGPGSLDEVRLSGAVEGRAVWPSNLKPVAWHRDADRVRMKLGLYHKTDQVYDGKVEYRDISIEGPNGIIRTSPEPDHEGHLYVGCFADDDDDHVFSGKKYVDAHMTNEMCADLCDGTRYFGTQGGTECWCSASKDRPRKHGKSKSCNKACPGTSRTETCGGRSSLSVSSSRASRRTSRGAPSTWVASRTTSTTTER